MTAETQHIQSILLTDCGTVTTKAMLVEQVAGQYRFVAQGIAPTTVNPPWSDLVSSIHQAVEQISQVTGRHFFDTDGRLISPEVTGNRGVDKFAATVSASQPLQVVLGGLVRGLSVASAERAVAGTYASIKTTLTGDSRGKLGEEGCVRAIRDAKPDVVCIAGGTENGAVTPVLELVETATLACSLMEPDSRPRLLYMGNSRLRRQVVEIVGEVADLRVADNVRPTPEDENLISAQEELVTMYVQKKMSQLSGIDFVSRWGPVPPSPTASAFGQLIQYLWHLGDPSKGVLGVDAGAANTTIAAVFDGQLSLTIRGDLGTALGGAQWLKQEDQEDAPIIRWLPEPMSKSEAWGVLINKEAYPYSVEQEPRELWVEQAVAREAIRTTLDTARPGWKPGNAQPYPHLLPLCDTIIVSGGALTHAPRPSHTALIVLDAVEPIGVSTLVLDPYGLVPALGSVAAVKPLAAVEALDNGGLVNLATVIAPVGRARPGDRILKVQITYEDDSKLSIDVHYGDLEVLPLPPGQEAVVELRPRRHFDVGLGGPGRGGKRRVSGGLVGLIIDARGRPLCPAQDPQQRQAQVQNWLWSVGG